MNIFDPSIYMSPSKYDWRKYQLFGNIIHIHAHKCGGTSLRLALELSNPESPVFEKKPHIHENEELHEKTPFDIFRVDGWQHASHALPKHIIADIGIDEYMNHTRVTVCRNPFARVVSMYTYFNKQNKERPRHASFEQFIKEDLAQNGYPRPFPPQKQYMMYNNEVVVDNILKLENIQADWTAFRNKYIINNETIEHRDRIPAEFPLSNRSNSRGYYRYFKHDPELIEIVTDMYQEDLEYFDYHYEF